MSKTKMLSFAAIDRYITDTIADNQEKEITGQNFISWGSDNKFPKYLFDLYKDVPTLQTLINGCVDYVCGDNIKSLDTNIISDNAASELVYDIALSYFIFGGFAISVTRRYNGGIAMLEVLDMRNVRSNKKNDVLFYSEDFNTKSYGRGKYVAYPKFGVNDINNVNSVYFYKNSKYQVYPLCLWNGAIISAELEKGINEYHINSLNNNFTASVIVNLNNGVPDDNIKDEIEKNFNEKFTGKENAGRVVISYNEDKEHEASIETIDTEDYSERYRTLEERSQKQLFTAFRGTPMLFGINDNSKGFARQEYQDAYTLFYNTVIKPVQRKIISVINEIYGIDIIEITPFKLQFETGETNDKNIL